MLPQDVSRIKERILLILKSKGPSTSMDIAKETEISTILASSFLSELLSDKRIKISHMKIGNSPVYFIPGQESRLEKFSHNLKGKEKEAFYLLKENKFLKASEQSPPMRVALRGIRDFAFPFKKNDETYWRYFTASESEFKKEIKPIEEHKFIQAKPKFFNKEERNIINKVVEDIKTEEVKTAEKILKEKAWEARKEELLKKKEEAEKAREEAKKEELIHQEREEKPKEEETKEKERKPRKPRAKPSIAAKRKAAKKKNEKFLEKIKGFLSKKNIEIINTDSSGKNEIIMRIKSDNSEKLLVAYNKKKLTDKDVINAYKKASPLNLKYVIMSLGEPSKKISALIESLQTIESIEKIEN